jgi:transcriptional regulator GlxA family with amidase domain
MNELRIFDPALKETELSLREAPIATEPIPAAAPRTAWIHPSVRWTHVLDVIEANLHRSLRVEELAREANLSQFHFAREFRKKVGDSPYSYITARRMERAKALLATSSLGIRDISRLVGFSTQAHFSGFFKQRSGTTPGRFRRESVAQPSVASSD